MYKFWRVTIDALDDLAVRLWAAVLGLVMGACGYSFLEMEIAVAALAANHEARCEERRNQRWVKLLRQREDYLNRLARFEEYSDRYFERMTKGRGETYAGESKDFDIKLQKLNAEGVRLHRKLLAEGWEEAPYSVELPPQVVYLDRQ
jgi:hypothetical protein